MPGTQGGNAEETLGKTQKKEASKWVRKTANSVFSKIFKKTALIELRVSFAISHNFEI